MTGKQSNSSQTCQNCGARMPAGAKFCGKCGTDLPLLKHPTRARCFGIRLGGPFVGLAIGAILLLWGFIMLLQLPGVELIPPGVSLWPFAGIILGIIIIIAVYFRLRRG